MRVTLRTDEVRSSSLICMLLPPLCLIRRAHTAPLAITAPVAAGMFAPEYSSLARHMSEHELRHDWIAWAVRLGAGISGLSIVLFSIGCFLLPKDDGGNSVGAGAGVAGGGTGVVRFSLTGLAAPGVSVPQTVYQSGH